MKKNYFFTFLLTLCLSVFSYGQDLLITGAFDGPNSGGTPKGIELYVINDIADLSIYGIGSANNGQGTDGEEFTFPADAVTAGTYIYIASEATEFTAFFGFAPTYNAGSAMGINGDDAIELFHNGSVIDTFGDINTDGTGEVWEYLDGWAYRRDGTTAGAFVVSDWTYSGINQLEGGSTNAATTSPFPLGTYNSAVSSDPAIVISGSVSSLDYFENNGPSSEGSFTVSGTNLTTDITVTAPANFEVSLTSGSGFANSIAVSQTAGTASATTVYVRLVAGLSSNTYSGDVTASSTGATNRTLAVSGVVSPDNPQITVTQFLDDLNYVASQGGPSPEDQFTVAGLFLTSNIVVTAPTNFEVSLTSGSGFATSVNITPSSGTVTQTTVYIRLSAGLSEANYNGNITISSTGVTDETIAINGNVYGTPTNSLVITGVFDGPLSGGTPKGIELYVLNDIPDLSLFGVSSVTNGGGTSGGNIEYSFPADAVTAGTYIYLATEDTQFNTFFGMMPTYTNGVVSINGDDAIELYERGQIIDTFGDVDMDGSGEPWDYVDGWAYRNSNTGPEGTTFTVSNWTYSGADAFDGESINSTASNPFPTGTYTVSTASVTDNPIEGFSAYPNPVINHTVSITSNSSDTKTIVLYNVLGKEVFNQKVNGLTNTIDVSKIQSGIYILKVTQGDSISTRKLVIQ